MEAHFDLSLTNMKVGDQPSASLEGSAEALRTSL